MPVRRLSREETGKRGVEIYDAKLRVLLEPQFHERAYQDDSPRSYYKPRSG